MEEGLSKVATSSKAATIFSLSLFVSAASHDDDNEDDEKVTNRQMTCGSSKRTMTAP